MNPAPSAPSRLCPSYVARPGARLLGIVGADGRVTLLKTPIRIDATFVAEARRGRPPEERFRFSGTCIERGCHQWEEGAKRCSLADRLISAQPASTAPADCPIRSRCRWFAQRGWAACAICLDVIRHAETARLTEPATHPA